MRRIDLYVLIFLVPILLQTYVLSLLIREQNRVALMYAIIIMVLSVIIMIATEWALSEHRKTIRMAKMEQMRSEFIASITHELKTPLTSIIGFTETLQNGAINDHDTALNFINIINEESNRLHELINSIIDMKGAMNTPTIFIVNDVIYECIELLSIKAAEKNVDIKLISSPAELTADRNKFKQIMINLIDNAIKYNKKGGRVRIKTAQTTESLNIEISDTGIGIHKKYLSRLFEPFYRPEPSRARETGGSGLGLSIIKNIIEEMGGSITVESNLNKGTTFKIEINRSGQSASLHEQCSRPKG